MSKPANPERRQDAPPPTDQGAWPQLQGYDAQPLAPDPPPKSDTTRPDDRGKQRAPPEVVGEDRDQTRQRLLAEDRDRDQARQRQPAEDRDQTRQRLPADDRDQTRQRPPADDRDQTRQRMPADDRDQTRQRPPADDRDQTRQRPPTDDRDQTRQRPPADDRDQIRQRPIVEDREQQTRQRPPADDRGQTKQRPLADDRGKQRVPPAEYPLQDRDRNRQRPPAPEDRGKQRAPQELLSEEYDPTNPRQRQPASDDRGKGRGPEELLQDPRNTERSPLFTRPNTPRPMYTAAGPSRGYDAYSPRQHSPSGSDDIAITDNRTQRPPPQHKPGFWARITGAMRDKGDPELEPGNTHMRGRLPQQPARPNVVLFGSHGAGRSSVINMLAGQEASRGSDRDLPAFANGGYLIDVGGREIVLWDVLGLHKEDEDREHDTISEGAAKNLHHMIQRLQGGVNLFVHCINAKHPSEAIVLVVTGLEDEVPMEGWWRRNEADIKNRGMTYDGHACITTIRGNPLKSGNGHWYDEQYEQSRLAVRELIKARLGAAVFIREEGKLAELRELLREQNAKAASQNGDKGKKTPSERTWASREVNGGRRSMQTEQWNDDMGDRVEREGRTASIALLGGLLAVFIVLHSGITSCV